MNKLYTVRVKFKTDKKDIIYINSIIDSYEGIGIVRTIDKKEGKVVVYSTNGMYKYVVDVLNELKKEGVKISEINIEESEKVDEW
ncbi:DUF4911 domain-containing protein [Deferribacter autotrophicus]|uniref:DUF4911 domain-containing protein n=1 Tax=Deferribacter autotrophicus TaxID=500465 RepID=A0A5A8F910_9BACT|nr:DUF4911 domain-containing protein [Deferribacter autotrophicus]KAA0259312.1 DUF4911 domain-containing protein [Deferribacter autotrophicus]